MFLLPLIRSRTTAFTRETKTEAYVIWDRYLAFCAHLDLVVVHRPVGSGRGGRLAN